MGLLSSLPVCKRTFVFLCPACSFFRSKTKRSLWRFHYFLKTYFIQLIPAQWEDSPEMAGDKEQSEHKSSLSALTWLTAVPAQLCFPSPISPKADSNFWELSIHPEGFSWAHGADVNSLRSVTPSRKVLFYFTGYSESFIASFIWKTQGKLQALNKYRDSYSCTFVLQIPSIQTGTEERDCSSRNTFW